METEELEVDLTDPTTDEIIDALADELATITVQLIANRIKVRKQSKILQEERNNT